MLSFSTLVDRQYNCLLESNYTREKFINWGSTVHFSHTEHHMVWLVDFNEIKVAQLFTQIPVSGWLLMMKSLNWNSAKSLWSAQYEWDNWIRSDEGVSWINTHSLGSVFVEYIAIKIVNFHLKYSGLFIYSTHRSSLTVASKMVHIHEICCMKRRS